jgi:hypothetical protein
VTEAGTPGDHLSVTLTHDADPSLAVQRSDSATWEVVHDRRVEESVLSSDWHAPWDTEPPTAVMGRAAREVACGFPLVESDMHDEGGDATIRFCAPVFDDGLTRQAFVLTVSAVLHAARVFDLVLARRAEDRVAWQEFEATSEQREREQQQVIDRVTGAASEATAPIAPTPPTPSSGVASPAVGWAPTHELKRRAQAWAQPDPGAAAAGTLGRRIPVQVIERRGDWARILCSNGWSGWIDSRDLKAR